MKSIIQLGNKIAALFIIILTVVAVFIPSFAIIDNVQDYMVHFLFFLIVSGLIGLVINNRIVLFASFSCAVLLAVFLKNASNSELKNPKINDEIRVSVAHINLSLITDVEVVRNIINHQDIVCRPKLSPTRAVFFCLNNSDTARKSKN